MRNDKIRISPVGAIILVLFLIGTFLAVHTSYVVIGSILFGIGFVDFVSEGEVHMYIERKMRK